MAEIGFFNRVPRNEDNVIARRYVGYKGRKASLSLRLMRLRVTLLPIRLLTEKPTFTMPVFDLLYIMTSILEGTDLPLR